MPLFALKAFVESLPTGGVLMGIDCGEKTFGLAVCDTQWRIASPLKTLRRHKRWKEDAACFQHLWTEYDVKGFVIGWPIEKEGKEGQRCHSTKHIVHNMLQVLDLPCLLWDERLSSQAALGVLRDEADLSRAKRKQVIDSVAAGWILQSALDHIHHNNR